MERALTPPWELVSLDALRATIADWVLGADDAPATVGSVALWPRQREAVARLSRAIAELGGALLADDVGTGKTFVALALAARHHDPLVVAPAALREVWRAAGERAGLRCRFVSMEALSRDAPLPARGDFVIVDEAHHARNPAARRYARLAALVAGAPLLLLSATPLHNARADLVALLALFLGGRAAMLDDAALARCVIRRPRDALGAVSTPRLEGPYPLHPAADDDALAESILALPPALPAAGAGSAHALLLVTMIRQWSSSALALRRGIERRLAAAHAIERSLAAGRHPTRGEIAAWTLGADAQQLAFPELLAPPAASEPPRPRALRAAVARHAAALRELARMVARGSDADRRRAECLREAWRPGSGERLLAFTQLADTVDAYWRALRGVPGVCALSARGGRIASGPIGRGAALAAFAPGAPPAAPAARIDALLTTDLASEGLDLQGASVLVHLDLPWTPARLEQRTGRVIRPGAPHAAVRTYVMEPPARAATLVAIRERLAAKLAAARLALGAVMPGLLDVGVAGDAAPPAVEESIRERLRRWRGREGARPCGRREAVLVAAVRVAGGRGGWLAAYGEDSVRLAASLGGEAGEGLSLVAAAVELASGEPAATEEAIACALREATRWGEARLGAALAGVAEIGAWSTRRTALARLAAAAHGPRSRRPTLASALLPARALAVARLGAGAEHRLVAAARSAEEPARWLDAVADVPWGDAAAVAPEARPLRALVVLVPASP